MEQVPAVVHAISGSLGGSVANLLLYPLDVVTVRLQTKRDVDIDNKRPDSGSKPDNLQIYETLKEIIRKEGSSALFKGVEFDLVATATQTFLYFFVYDYLRNREIRRLITKNGVAPRLLSIYHEFLFGATAGMFCKLFTTPIKNIVVLKQVDRTQTKTVLQCINEISENKGITGLWSGYRATLLLSANPSFAYYFYQLLGSYYHMESSVRVFVRAAMAKSLATLLTYPVILGKTRTQARPESSNLFVNIWKALKLNGVVGMYDGMNGQLLKGCISQGITMTTKESISKFVVMSLYTLDGNTRKLLKLDRFGAPDFSERSFIEQLSGSQRHLDDDYRLDPKPYIRTFECAATELERLHEIALSQEEAACTAAAELSESRNLEVQDIASNVQKCVEEVKALDESSTEICQITGSVGQNLERITHHHAQISNYRALISAYLSFLAERQPSELSRLWQTDVRKCALFVAQLQTLATAIGPLEGKPDVQKHIDKYAENLENHLLSNFLDSYQNFDLPGMRESADILFEFNGGGSVVQAYINQHRFFMNVDHLQQQHGEEESSEYDVLWRNLRTADSHYPEFVQIVEKSVNEITETIARETEIITKVFSRPAQVLSMFIQRTFAQKIQGLVTSYMEEAADQPETLPQVRVLGLCYTKINDLVTELQKIWSHSGSGLSDSEQVELGAVLESNFLDAFVLYVDDYLELEEKSLTEIVDQEFGTTTADVGRTLSTVSTNTTTTEDGRMERLRRAMRNFRYDDGSNANDDGNGTGASTEEIGNGAAGNENESSIYGGNKASDNNNNHFSHPSSPRTPSTPSGQSSSTGFKEVTITNLQNVLAAFGEAISREQVLRPSHMFASDATVMYNLLTREIGGRYISAVIDNALALSYKVDTKSPIDWTFMENIRISGHALRLVSAFVKTVLFAMVQASPDTLQNMADALNMYIINVQRSCRELIEQIADLMHLRVRTLFNKNSKRDFLEPTSEDGILSPEIYEELVNIATVAKNTLSLENCNRLLSLIAINFCDDLLAHIPQFTISLAGGTALSNDIAEYERLLTQDWVQNSQLTDKFAMLRAISRLYTADQSLLSSLLRDSHLSKLAPSQLRLYLSQRADSNPRIMSLVYFQNNLQYRDRY